MKSDDWLVSIVKKLENKMIANLEANSFMDTAPTTNIWSATALGIPQCHWP